MLSVKGMYENGQVQLLEPVPFRKRARVIVTILDDQEKMEAGNQKGDIRIFDDLVGVINMRRDGSISHDDYIIAQKH